LLPTWYYIIKISKLIYTCKSPKGPYVVKKALKCFHVLIDPQTLILLITHGVIIINQLIRYYEYYVMIFLTSLHGDFESVLPRVYDLVVTGTLTAIGMLHVYSFAYVVVEMVKELQTWLLMQIIPHPLYLVKAPPKGRGNLWPLDKEKLVMMISE
jgi:hypothetical protein